MANHRGPQGRKIAELLIDGLSNKQISDMLGCSPSTVSYQASKLGLCKPSYKYDWNVIRKRYYEGATYNDIVKEFGITLKSLWQAGKRGKFIPRPQHKAMTAEEHIESLNKNPNRKPGTGRYDIRRKILKEDLLSYLCAICNIDTWEGKPLTLRLDHINGDGRDNSLTNLRFVCPNCDSQQDTYCHKNRGRYKDTNMPK